MLKIDVVYQHLQIEYGGNNFTSQSNEIHVSQLLIMIELCQHHV